MKVPDLISEVKKLRLFTVMFSLPRWWCHDRSRKSCSRTSSKASICRVAKGRRNRVVWPAVFEKLFAKRKAREAKERKDDELRAFVLTLIDQDGVMSGDDESKFLGYLRDHDYADPSGVVDSNYLPEDVADEARLALAKGGRFPRCEATLLLKAGETAYTEVTATLLKEVADKEMQGASQGISIPLGHGVRYRTGSVRGRMVTVGTHWQPADSGILTITDKRVVYHGGRKTLEFAFPKLATLNAYSDAIDLGVTNRQATSTFRVDDPAYVSGMVHAAFEHNKE